MRAEAWDDVLAALRSQGDLVAAWPREAPNGADRCAGSRHRTLGHLRAAQETWLEAIRRFQTAENPRVTLRHPWRKFDSQGYAQRDWAEHMDHYRADRQTWLELVAATDFDRARGGTLNRNPRTCESLTRILQAHEKCHLI
jgi:hypothetical protein